MDTTETQTFDQLLVRAGVKRSELALVLGVGRGTVSRWKEGRVPEYAMVYLRREIELNRYRP